MRTKVAFFFSVLLLASPTLAQGFGRFGRIHDDGLLTLNITPQGISVPPTAGNLSLLWGSVACEAGAVRGLTPTEKCLSLRGGGVGAPSSVRYSLLYPGAAATFGKTLTLRWRGRATCDTSQPGVALFTGDGPALAVFFPREATVHATQNTLTARSAHALGEVRFVTPLGIGAGKASRALAFWQKCPLPMRRSAEARLSKDGKTVTVTERFTGRLAPIPPVLAFAQSQGYPVRFEKPVVRTEALTKWGPFAYVRGDTLRYTLPVPSTELRGYVRPRVVSPAQTARVALLNTLVGHLGGDWATNAVDLAYAGMTNAALAAPYLDASRKAELARAWKKYLPRAWPSGGSAWKTATEPLTGQSYLWTYKIDGPGGYNYDLDWGNALPLYGLSIYIAYSGDLRTARRHWADVKRVGHYFTLGDDWAWLTVVNADHGYSTGTGDPLCATFAGHLACLRLARLLGDKPAEERFAVQAARCAVPTLARFWYTDFARKNNLIGSESLVLGFHETEGFTRAQFGKDDPWNAATLLSGDGCLPELFTFYAQYGKPALTSFERANQRAYPNLDDPRFRYPFETTYEGNSVYVTFPHLMARRMVLGEPASALWPVLERAAENRNNAWIAPNVIAELLSADVPLLLTDWGDCGYLEGTWDADTETAHLTFTAQKAGSWKLGLRLKPGWRLPEKQALPQTHPAGNFTILLRLSRFASQ